MLVNFDRNLHLFLKKQLFNEIRRRDFHSR
jgi:hypothetical protein